MRPDYSWSHTYTNVHLCTQFNSTAVEMSLLLWRCHSHLTHVQYPKLLEVDDEHWSVRCRTTWWLELTISWLASMHDTPYLAVSLSLTLPYPNLDVSIYVTLLTLLFYVAIMSLSSPCWFYCRILFILLSLPRCLMYFDNPYLVLYISTILKVPFVVLYVRLLKHQMNLLLY